MEQVRIVIENVTPKVDCGRFAAKAVVGDKVEVGPGLTTAQLAYYQARYDKRDAGH